MAEPRHFCIYCGKPYEAKMIVKYDYHRGRFRECQVQHGGYQRREDLSFSLLIAGLGVRPLCVPGLDVLHYSAERALRPRRA